LQDWQEIIKMYEVKNIYLCEAATTLQRLVQYEVPALKKAITKAVQTGDVGGRTF
jgi:hypothetical protein